MKPALFLTGCVLLLCSLSRAGVPSTGRDGSLSCTAPAYLQAGDKVALVSPAYFIPIRHIIRTAEVLRDWGLEPVIAPNVGKRFAGKYAGTVEEREADLRWAIQDPSIKAIICNGGGYGTLHLLDRFTAEELGASPKWLVGYSDITTLLGMETCAGVMSLHAATSSSIAKSEGKDANSLILRDMLLGTLPRYELPAHPLNRVGKASGVLVGGNISTLVPCLETWADVTRYDNIIIFLEEVEETMHHIDRLFHMLLQRGLLARCSGIILGGFTDCEYEFDYASIEQMLEARLPASGIPILCGFPAGHDPVNLPLVFGAPVTLEVRPDGASLDFNLPGGRQVIRTAELQPPVSIEAPVPEEKAGTVTDSRDFVVLTDVVPDALLEIRYYSSFNFVGARVDGYQEPVALLTRQAADSLKKVSDALLARGYRLKIYDAYRPQCAVDHFIRWSRNVSDTLTKRYFYPGLDKERLFELGYVARRSSHSRGSTVDLTLVDMKTGREVDMGAGFDWFGRESHPDFGGDPDTGRYIRNSTISAGQFQNRMILRTEMLRHGFEPYSGEWWHFTLSNEPYPDTYFNFPVARP